MTDTLAHFIHELFSLTFAVGLPLLAACAMYVGFAP